MENSEKSHGTLVIGEETITDFDTVYAYRDYDTKEPFYVCVSNGTFENALAKAQRRADQKKVVIGVVCALVGIGLAKAAPIVTRKVRKFRNNRKQKSIKG